MLIAFVSQCGSHGPLVIPVLRRLKMDQTEREDGVQSHLEESRNADDGRRDDPVGGCGHFR